MEKNLDVVTNGPTSGEPVLGNVMEVMLLEGNGGIGMMKSQSAQSQIQAQNQAQVQSGVRTLILSLLLSSGFGLIACAPTEKIAHKVNISTTSNSESNVDSTGIIGGENASGEEDYSKTIAIIYNASFGSLCTASIYSDTILITAAHCVDGPASSLRVVFGTDIANAHTRTVRPAVSYVVSPLWAFRQNEELNAGDIAIVKFAGGLPAGFKPAKILNSTANLATGEAVLLAGYGINDGVNKSGSGILRYVETTIEDASYTDTEVLIEQRFGKGACHGDSGGPAYVKVDGEWMLFGVTNRGVNDPQDHCNGSAAYANIPFYMTWIEQSIAALEEAATSAPSVASTSTQSRATARMAAGF